MSVRRSKGSSNTDINVEERLMTLLDGCPQNNLALSSLQEQYTAKFGEILNVKALGFRQLKSLVESFASFEVDSQNSSSELFVFRTPAKEKSNSIDFNGIVLIDTTAKLDEFIKSSPFSNNEKTNDEAVVYCERVNEALVLVVIGLRDCTFVLDCLKLESAVDGIHIGRLLSDPLIPKILHDIHGTIKVLRSVEHTKECANVFDTQLAMEIIHGDTQSSLDQMLYRLGLSLNTSSMPKQKSPIKGNALVSKRPLSAPALKAAADVVASLRLASIDLNKALSDDEKTLVRKASLKRADYAQQEGSVRRYGFVKSNYRVTSYELLEVMNPEHILELPPIVMSNDASSLLELLPSKLSCLLLAQAAELNEVTMDLGKSPIAWIGKKRLIFSEVQIRNDDIVVVCKKVGPFGHDNRAGLDGQLHRISAIRGRGKTILGLTLRAGRHISGNVHILMDVLFGKPNLSVLFLGEPGSGKTTIVREVSRLLAEQVNVCIVDTSNEIAGDGNIPHHCVGHSRRMMVPSLNAQSGVMVECVQNHTPTVMVIDEIGRSPEVEAARTCKNRGVRLVASAHGDLRKLVKNPQLRGLVGGIQKVTIGDEQASADANKRKREHPGLSEPRIRKTKAERAGPPIFDVVVELTKGSHNEWRIVMDSGEAVDKILEGGNYDMEIRSRTVPKGDLLVHFGQG